MNENERPTPRTDGSVWETDHENPCGPIEVVSAKFSRQLERELAEAREKLREWEDAAKAAENPHPDEAHCTCVPLLTASLAETRKQRDRQAEALKEIHELAGWHTDDNADPDDQCPDDAVAHYNGLIRQKSLAAVKK